MNDKARLVAHRGNIFGSNLEKENSPDYLLEALDQGYSVEADFRLVEKFSSDADFQPEIWLGHDLPQYRIEDFANTLDAHLKGIQSFYFHAKDELSFVANAGVFTQIFDANVDLFYNENDAVTLTLNGNFWIHPKFDDKFMLQLVDAVGSNMIFVLDKDQKDLAKYLLKNTEANVCCDYVGELVEYV